MVRKAGRGRRPTPGLPPHAHTGRSEPLRRVGDMKHHHVYEKNHYNPTWIAVKIIFTYRLVFQISYSRKRGAAHRVCVGRKSEKPP